MSIKSSKYPIKSSKYPIKSSKYPITRKIVKKKYYYYWNDKKKITDSKKIQELHNLRIPPAYKNVRIYSSTSKIQYDARDERERIQKGYHPVWIQERTRKKFIGLIDFVKAYPTIMKKVHSILPKNNTITTKEQLVALAISLLDICKIRPGNEKHLENTGSYGTTTLQKKHIQKKPCKQGTCVSLSFMGKSKVQNTCFITSPSISKMLLQLSSIVGTNYILETKKDTITGKDINDFLRKIGKSNTISAKSFRTYHANILFLEKIRNTFSPDSTKQEQKKNFVQTLKETAKELHHNPPTCKNSYLYPSIHELYTKDYKKFVKIFENTNTQKTFISFIQKHTPKTSNIPSNWKH